MKINDITPDNFNITEVIGQEGYYFGIAPIEQPENVQPLQALLIRLFTNSPLVQAITEMRQAQKAYFAATEPKIKAHWFRAALNKEHKVDKLLEALKNDACTNGN